MNFSDRLNNLFIRTGFSNKQISDISQLDASLMSKYRHGKRSPRLNSPQLKSICGAFVTLAKEENVLESLCQFCNIDSHQNEFLLVSKLETWLTTDTNLKLKKSSIKKELDMLSAKHSALFNQKVNNLFTTFDVPNREFAQLLFIDPSLVSKLRNGTMDFSRNKNIMHNLSYAFTDIALRLPQEKYKDIFQTLLDYVPDFDKNTIYNALLNWLKEDDDLTKYNYVEKFLSFFDHYKRDNTIPDAFMDAFIPKNKKLSYGNQTFIGREGLQTAILQQLIMLSAQKTPQTLYLYTDQPMNWITDYPEYSKTWDILMSIIIQKKHRVFMINHFNREKFDMQESLLRWYPIYMSGQLDAVFCEYDLSSKFHHSIFIVPGLCSVESNFIVGTDDEAAYVFSVKKSKIEYQMDQFNALVKLSRPFFKVLNLDKEDEYETYIQSTHNLPVPNIRIAFSPLISTMSPELFEKILSENSLSQKDEDLARKYYIDSKEDFYNHINLNQVVHFIKCPSKGEYSGDTILIDLPIEDLYYTKENLHEHLSDIEDILKKHNNFRFYPAPSIFPSGLVFPSKSIFLLNQNTNVTSINKNTSYQAFIIDSPELSKITDVFYKTLKLLDTPQNYDYKDCLETFTQNMT